MAAYGIPTNIDSVVLATSLSDYQKTMADNVYNANVMLKILATKKKLINGGLSIAQPLMIVKQDAGGFFLGADPLNNTQPNFMGMAEWQWQNMYEPIVLTRDEERQNAGDEHKILSLVATKTKSSEMACSDRLEQAVSGPLAGSGNLIDLDTLVGTGTVGNVPGSSVTAWQSTVTASGAFATQGLADMTTATYAVSSSAENENPTHYFMSKSLFQKFEQTRLPLERIQNGDFSANAGFKSLTFKGQPVVFSNYITPATIYGINMNYIDFNVDTATDMITTDYLTPTNQMVRVAYILWRGALSTDNRRRHFKLTSVT